MKILNLSLCLLALVVGTSGQDSGPKEWTPWTAVKGDWVQFVVLINFGEPPEKIAKKELKSLTVGCLIAGKVTGEVPADLHGVKTFRIIYTEYGEFNRDGFFKESSLEIPYKPKGQYIPEVGILRKASQFDVAEASKPVTEFERTVTFPTMLSALGVDPLKAKIRGRQYLVGAEWRRKGKTVEIKIKDYRPSVPNTSTTPIASPTP